MATFDEFMAGYNFDPATFNAEQFRQDVARAHADELGIREAKITQLTDQGAASAAEVQALKARNYDLLMQVPQDTTENEGGNPPADNPTDPMEAVANLFGKRE